MFVTTHSTLDTHQPLPGVHVGDVGPKVRSHWTACIGHSTQRAHAFYCACQSIVCAQFAFSTIDNGFLRLTHVRIPRSVLAHAIFRQLRLPADPLPSNAVLVPFATRTDMLSRNAAVLKGGVYEKPANTRLGYAGMLTVRANMVMDAASQLAQSVTIAIRYTPANCWH